MDILSYSSPINSSFYLKKNFVGGIFLIFFHYFFLFFSLFCVCMYMEKYNLLLTYALVIPSLTYALVIPSKDVRT